jgi:hypothetical protein
MYRCGTTGAGVATGVGAGTDTFYSVAAPSSPFGSFCSSWHSAPAASSFISWFSLSSPAAAVFFSISAAAFN